ncbi:MAG TPA: NUDIX hydrolase [Solirubrobacteraceae bacterium]|nr:NUDIX hydrolase [Solirubrobacteraceae bacterium]
MSEGFERLGSETKWEGRIVSARVERWRHADGEEVEREVVSHQGAVAVVAHDDEKVWLVRQPREPVNDPALLELPAGKLDVEDERPLQTAQRELAEEVGKSAASWRELDAFYTSPGFSDERVVVYLATELADADAQAGENERIEVVPWPLARLDEAIDACEDAKSLVGLLWLRALRSSRG